MDRCWLDWWANSSALLGSFEVSVVVTADGAGWAASGHLVDDNDDFAFLCELDPVFQLRFDDESTLTVTVHPAGDGFTLTEYAGPAERPVSHRIDLRTL